MTMNPFAHFPARPHWTAQQLADAVPLRLHQLFAFDARDGADERAANAARHRARDARYVQRSSLPPRFGVH
jgi:hypothetical protein